MLCDNNDGANTITKGTRFLKRETLTDFATAVVVREEFGTLRTEERS